MKRITKNLPLLLAALAVIITFFVAYQYFLNDFADTATHEESDLDSSIRPATEFMQTMAIYSDNFFTYDGSYDDSELYDLFVYDSVSNSYTLDAIEGTDLERASGNITGSGTIPENGLARDELSLVLSYTDLFANFYNQHPSCAWIYYTSENDFIDMYPWISSENFKYDEKLQTVEFYTVATPENDPLRAPVWTSVYLDEAGKGSMVSLSSPVYDGDTFMGVISIDFTCDKLSKILDSQYDGYLLDASSSVLATDTAIGSFTEIPQLTDLMDISQNSVQEILQADSGELQRVGMYYVYTYNPVSTPWTLVVSTPIYSVLGKSLLATLPIVVICMLLLVAQKEIERRKKAEEEIRRLAITDTLTGLHNRYFLDTIIEKTLSHSDRYNEPLSAIMLDIDHFKRVNDQWGHPIGDEVLIQTAEAIKSVVRKADILVRFGGEEFLLLLPKTDIVGAQITAEKIRETIETKRHRVAGNYTASLGVVERHAGESFTNLYRRVDEALYLAKESGRNRVALYNPKKSTLLAPLYFEWDNQWDSGDKTIDEQHRGLLEITNALMLMSSSGAGHEKLEQQVDTLLQHIVDHFEYEENLLIDISYPDYKEHAETHTLLTSKAMKAKVSYKHGELGVSAFFSFMADDVVIGHMVEDDAKFFPYILKNR